MELIGIVVLGVLGLLGAALSQQLADEFKAWTPKIIDWVIRCAVRKLPEDQRERFGEEWRSHINETPGEIGKFFNAVSLLSAPRKMPKSAAIAEPLAKPTMEEILAEDEGAFAPIRRVSSVMKNGDHVDVTVNGREVGPGRIVDANRDPVIVIVETPRRGPYQFGASRSFFGAIGPDGWCIDMPSPTLREFLPDE